MHLVDRVVGRLLPQERREDIEVRKAAAYEQGRQVDVAREKAVDDERDRDVTYYRFLSSFPILTMAMMKGSRNGAITANVFTPISRITSPNIVSPMKIQRVTYFALSRIHPLS